jgi:hypothetical protein
MRWGRAGVGSGLVRSAVDEQQPVEELGPVGGTAQGDVRAQRLPGQRDRTAVPELLCGAAHIGRVPTDDVGAGHGGTAATTA